MNNVNVIHVGQDTAIYLNSTQVMVFEPTCEVSVNQAIENFSGALGVEVTQHNVDMAGDWNWDDAKEVAGLPPASALKVGLGESYTAYAMSTSELTPADKNALDLLSADEDQNCYFERVTGYFIKLTTDSAEQNIRSEFSDTLNSIIISAVNGGYQLLEFDMNIE
jgi:hypothetical protein